MSGIIRIDLPSARRSLGRRPPPAPAIRPVRFFTNHGFFGLFRSPAVRHSFWSEPGPPTMVFTNHESRDTNHGFYAFVESLHWGTEALQSFFSIPASLA